MAEIRNKLKKKITIINVVAQNDLELQAQLCQQRRFLKTFIQQELGKPLSILDCFLGSLFITTWHQHLLSTIASKCLWAVLLLMWSTRVLILLLLQ